MIGVCTELQVFRTVPHNVQSGKDCTLLLCLFLSLKPFFFFFKFKQKTKNNELFSGFNQKFLFPSLKIKEILFKQ